MIPWHGTIVVTETVTATTTGLPYENNTDKLVQAATTNALDKLVLAATTNALVYKQ